jgi:hypothetical protein
MNVMLVCPAGDVFIGSIDMTGHKKTKEYITEELRIYIEAIGPNNMIQICSENASTMLGQSYSHVSPFVQARLLCLHSRPSPRRLEKRINVQDPNNEGQAGVYLHPKPPCDNGIVSPLFTEVVVESTTGDKVCMQLPHDCLHA